MGVITGDCPEMMYAPPQDPVYQFQLAEVPRLPPVIPRLDCKPEQIVEGIAVAEVAETESELKVTVIVTQDVEPHKPSALTK